jgi:signal transduction histidine kinase
VIRLRRLTLRQRLVAMFLIVGALLTALAVVAAVTAEANRGHLDTILDESGPMRVAGESLGTALVEQEAGVRGYLLSGDPADLGPYRRGIVDEARHIAEIQRLIGAGDESLRRQLETVRSGAQRWRVEVAEPVIAEVRAGGPRAGEALLREGARTQFAAVRAAQERLEAEIHADREQSAAAARWTSATLVLLLIFAAVIFVLSAAGLMLLVDRMVTGPLLSLAHQVRDAAGGHHERRIASDGPPELARLAADVDGMRQQIATELAQVREARSQIEWVNQQLHAQAEELTRSNRDLEQFAYVASHDLQEPLRKVASFCQLLQRRYAGQLDERADQYIGFAVDGAQRMQRLINDLLAFSRIGRLTSGFVEVDLNQVLVEVASQLEVRGADSEIIWSELPVVEGEEPLLTTLFVNLIGNSLKFHRPDVPPRVEVSVRRVDDEWEFTVRDNGIGIEQEFADKVFVIFQRLHGRDAYEGTGIGLAIVKKIVEHHSGRIWLDPDVRDGTAVRFTLPVLIGYGEPPTAAVDDPAGPIANESAHEVSA